MFFAIIFMFLGIFMLYCGVKLREPVLFVGGIVSLWAMVNNLPI